MKAIDVTPNRPSYWQLIFSRSKVNGAVYDGESLPRQSWDWPNNTYLQRRLIRRHDLNRVESANVH